MNPSQHDIPDSPDTLSHANTPKTPPNNPEKPDSPWRIMDPVRPTIRVAMAISALASASSLISILSLAFALHALVQPTAPPLYGIHFSTWQWFAIAALSTIIGYTTRGLSFKISHQAAFALERILRNDMTAHISAVSLGKLSEYGSSGLAKVIQDDVRDLHAFVADSTPLYARAYFAPLATLALLFWFDWRLALVALGIFAIGLILMSVPMASHKTVGAEYNRSREKVNQAVIEFVQAMPVVRTFDGGQTSFGRYERALDRYLTILIEWYRALSVISRSAMIVLSPLPTLVGMIWVGAYFFWHGSLDFTIWIAILLLSTGVAESLYPVMSIMHLIEKANISINRIKSVQLLPKLTVPQECKHPKDASITFDQVTFQYEGRETNALEEVSFEVAEGSFTAMVGASGAGKSTAARLIPRFWDVTGGSIRVGSVDVRDIDPQTLMEQVAFVFQDNFLFSGSILDNIRLGQEHRSLEEVTRAAVAAQAHDFISAFPDGYDTLVGERGACISGGQRQRITIARAILQNRPILILDEATAFADAENEALLMKALRNLMQNKTVLMIAHRLSTIQNADQVVVFERGKVVETGSPTTLSEQDGPYARLWNAYQHAQNWQIRLSGANS